MDKPLVPRPSANQTATLPPFTDLLAESWTIFRFHHRLILWYVAALALFGAGVALLQPSETPSQFTLARAMGSQSLSLGQTLISYIFYLALLLQMHGRTSQDEKQTLHAAWSRVGMFFVTGLAQGLVIMGSAFTVVGPVLFGVWGAFTLNVFVDQDIHTVRALAYSRELTRGRWWAIFWRFLLLSVVFLLPATVFIIGATIALILIESLPLFNVIVAIYAGYATSFALAFRVALYDALKKSRGHIDVSQEQLSIYRVFLCLGALLPFLFIGAIIALAVLAIGAKPL